VLKSLNLGDDSVILKIVSCSQMMLCIVMMQIVCLEHRNTFIIQKSGIFLLTD
jgi:hypothetical protein